MSYIDFDEFGIQEIRCMICNTPIARRMYTEMPNIKDPSLKTKVPVIGILENKGYMKVEMSDGSIAEPPVCKTCSVKDPDTDALMVKIREGWEQEMRWAGKPDKHINAYKAKTKGLKVKRRVK